RTTSTHMRGKHTASMKRLSQSCSNMVPSPGDTRICVDVHAYAWKATLVTFLAHVLEGICVGLAALWLLLHLPRISMDFHAYAWVILTWAGLNSSSTHMPCFDACAWP
ncbi:hypothetical protein PIB30_108159, partial [Stylosanthes scabra]|nr:hypothetical protein [Stylosanthes scabra]